MAESTQALTFKLVVDGKEAIATLDLTKGEFVETGAAANAASEQVKKTYQGLIAEALKYNQVTDANITKLTEYIGSQNISVDVIENTIRSLDIEANTLGVNTAAWKQKVMASTNLKAALGGLMQQQTAYGNVNQQTLPGVNSMRMAVQQFGYVLNDSQMFMVNARMGMMGIANNIPMIIQLFQQAKQSAGENVSMMQLLTKAITGGGGLIIGINALFLVMQFLPALFEDTTKSIEEQKEAVKKLKDEYEKLTREQLNNFIQSREEELRKLEEKHPYKKSSLPRQAFIGPGKMLQIFEGDRFGKDQERYEQIQREIAALEEVARDLGVIENVRNRITLNQEQLNKLNEDETSPFYFKNIVKTAESYEDAKRILNEWIAADEKLVKSKDKSKLIDEEFDKAVDKLELAQSHALKMAEIEDKSDKEILQMKKQFLAEQINLYEQYGKDVIAVLLELAEVEAQIQKCDKSKKSGSEADVKGADKFEKYKNEREKFFNQFFGDKLEELKIEEETNIKRAELFGATEEQKLNIQRYYARQRQEFEEKQMQQELQNVSSYLGQSAALFAKHTAAYKILSVAQIMIDTYAAAQAAFKAMAGIPVVGPVLAVAAAASAIVAGIQRANAIKAIQIKEMGGFATGGRLPKGSAGFIEGTHNEIIAPEEDFKSIFKTYSSELVKHALVDARNFINVSSSSNTDLSGIKESLNRLNKQLDDGITAIAFYDNKEVRKIRAKGSSMYRRGKI